MSDAFGCLLVLLLMLNDRGIFAFLAVAQKSENFHKLTLIVLILLNKPVNTFTDALLTFNGIFIPLRPTGK